MQLIYQAKQKKYLLKEKKKYFNIHNPINLLYSSLVAGTSAQARAVKIKNTIRRRRRST